MNLPLATAVEVPVATDICVVITPEDVAPNARNIVEYIMDDEDDDLHNSRECFIGKLGVILFLLGTVVVVTYVNTHKK